MTAPEGHSLSRVGNVWLVVSPSTLLAGSAEKLSQLDRCAVTASPCLGACSPGSAPSRSPLPRPVWACDPTVDRGARQHPTAEAQAAGLGPRGQSPQGGTLLRGVSRLSHSPEGWTVPSLGTRTSPPGRDACSPGDASRLHLVGHSDVGRPHVVLPAFLAQDAPQHGARVHPHAHVHPSLRLLPHVPARHTGRRRAQAWPQQGGRPSVPRGRSSRAFFPSRPRGPPGTPPLSACA